jgi:Na+/melibiose symporter-like transporter
LLDNANALAEATTSVATTVGAAGAAALVLAVGAVPGFGVNIALFAAAAVLLAMITVRELARPDSAPARARQPWRRDLGEVVAYLRRHPALWRLTVVEILVGFFVTMFSTFLVVYTVDLVGAPASQFGYLIAAYSGGFFVGSLLAPRLGVVRWYGWAFVVTILVAAGLLGLLVVVPRFETAVVALLLLGGFLGLVVTGFVTLVQRSVPSELLGRYFGLNEMLTWTVAPIGIAVGGILTDAYGVRVTYIVAAAGLLLVGALALALKDVRQVGYRRTPGLPAASEPARENPPA